MGNSVFFIVAVAVLTTINTYHYAGLSEACPAIVNNSLCGWYSSSSSSL
jgi:hypothetical protein